MLLDAFAMDDKVQTSGDVIRKSTFTNPTGIYNCLVELAYVGESAKGAKSITVHFTEVGGSVTHRETFYFTNRNKEITFIDKKTKKPVVLPGYELMNDLAMITAGKPLAQLKDENKMVKRYDFESRSEKALPTDILPELMGKPVRVALHLNVTNKNKLIDGKYKRTAEKREFNSVNKLFHPDKYTVAEKLAGATEPAFMGTWLEEYDAEYVYDTYKEVQEEAVASAIEQASAAAASEAAGEDEDLFK